MDIIDINALQKSMEEFYGQTLTGSQDLKTNACSLGTVGFNCSELKVLEKIHPEVKSKFYGCGSPIPFAIKGLVLLDLGCGVGRDVFIASSFIGDEGKAMGVDLTHEQLEVAIRHSEYHIEQMGLTKNIYDFRKGPIEDLKSLGFQDNSVDVVISNCVINLSANKKAVFSEIWRILKDGGELFFSDMFADRRIPDHIKNDPSLWGEGLGGASYFEDFRRMMSDVGFKTYLEVKKSQMKINDPSIQIQVGPIKYFAVTIRAYKIAELEDRSEDYQQVAIYLGTVEDHPDELRLDSSHLFKTGEAVHICRNFGLIFTESRLAKHFKVSEQKDHQGILNMPGVCESQDGSCC